MSSWSCAPEVPIARSTTRCSYVVVILGGLAALIVVVGLVAVISAGFALSFDAIGAVGRASGMRSDLAWLLPAAVDGAMAVGTVTAVVVRRLRRSTVYPWTVVLVNTTISVACNGLHAYEGATMTLPTSIAVAVSAVPAVNLALSVHLLVLLVDALADALLQQTTIRIAGEDTQESRPLQRPDDQALTISCEEAEAGSRCEPAALAQVRLLSGRELQRAAWKWAVENRRMDGSLPSGTEIAKAHGRSPRWGRLVRNAGLSGYLDVGHGACSSDRQLR